MAEYILKQAVLDALRTEGITLNMRTYKRVQAIKAADVAPVRHGRWIMRGGRFHCSLCDAKAKWDCEGCTGGWSREYTQAESECCPNCGAKMDG